jgi:hypothetical protein
MVGQDMIVVTKFDYFVYDDWRAFGNDYAVVIYMSIFFCDMTYNYTYRGRV